ncbi:MAG: arsenite methyltransferase [Chloroflexi bacterium]|nr:arsenite methyltransferase [Chloroflexota bacterium]
MNTDIKKTVRQRYATIARKESPCCPPVSSCCGSSPGKAGTISQKVGYSAEELQGIPEEANLGLGCGNPVALASLKEGDTVLDLGSGAGIDCLLAAARVGDRGRVIGVDMTPEMIDRARENARKGNYHNVEFRLGEIENLPATDSSVDAIISNCVINLSPDKPRVFREAYRVLRPGGRIMVSDIVLLQPLPEKVRDSIDAYIGCISGALLKDDYLEAVHRAGFTGVATLGETTFSPDYIMDDPTAQSALKALDIPVEQVNEMVSYAVSIKVQAFKPVQAVGSR